MNEEILKVLQDILFQLHVISSQNFTVLAQTEGEDYISEKTRAYGISGLAQEREWMEGFNKARGDQECASGIGSSSDS